MIIQLNTSTSGTFTALDTQQDVVMLHEAAISATMTFAFPSTPTNGQSVTFLSVGGVTALTLSAVTGTILNGLTALTAGLPSTYMYYSPTTKWYRIK